MIAKGIILEINRDNTCKVHVPLFDTAGISLKSIITATFAITPGLYNSYSVDDVVYIGFENNEIDNAVVLGKLYVSPEKESSRKVGAIVGSNLEITGSAKLPANTTIGTMSAEDIANLNNKLNLLSDKLGTKSASSMFSANEQIIGTWFDGKALYRKTYVITHSPVISSNTDFLKDFSISDLNFENIWQDLTHTIQIGNQYSLNSYNTQSQSDYFNCYIDTVAKKVYYRGHTPDTVSQHIITVEYTKK